MKLSLSKSAEIAISRLEEKGFEAYAVGGSVRDLLLGKNPYDFDVTTSATPDEIKAVFNGYRMFFQGIKHGTVSVVIDGDIIEITTFREDTDYTDHRHPGKVNFTKSLDSDLKRRDFTMNALVYSNSVGLVDKVGGLADIENKIIRAIGDGTVRFEEDALRIYRALRFSSQLGFIIEENTKKAIYNKKSLIRNVSAERIESEITKLVAGAFAGKVIDEYREVLEEVFGGYLVDDLGDRVEAVDGAVTRLVLFLSLTEYGVSKLNCSAKLKNYSKTAKALTVDTKHLNKAEIKKLIYKYGVENVAVGLEVAFVSAGLDFSAERATLVEIAFNNEPCDIKSLDISGNDLTEALGIKGKAIGEALEKLLFAVMDEKVENKKEKLIEYLNK